MPNPNPNTDGLIPFEKDPNKENELINRTGKNKGHEHSRTRLLRLLNIVKKVKNEVDGTEQEFTALEIMDMKQIVKAIDNSDTKAYKEILDRLEGTPTQTINQVVSGEVNKNPNEWVGEEEEKKPTDETTP